MQGKVWLVGAGPGDIGLFTLKGAQVLSQADVVVYDALVGQSILSLIPAGAKIIHVGKRAGNHTVPQWRINEILLEEAQAGRKVVRLKGGDPFLFGRGGEELELLQEHGIPFEIVPGVTSATAVPAYNGIPVTHRDLTQSLHIITGHRREDRALDIDFRALVETGGTLVFLMGLSSLSDIVSGLMQAGMDPEMPSAVLQMGTTAGQRRVTAPLCKLEETAAKEHIQPPAIIVTGRVCGLADRFAWYESRPLAGKKIVVTRPRELISEMAARLREEGAEVLELPAIRTEAVSPNPALCAALEEIREKGAYDWVIFTSPTGVRIFFEQVCETGDIRLLSGSRIAAIGKGTKKALRDNFLQTDFIPTVADGAHLGAELAACLTGGERILIPRAEQGNRELTEALQAKDGVEVLDIPTYRTLYEKSPVIDEKALFESGSADYAVFTSASTVRGFAQAAQGLDMTKVRAVCIGTSTQAAAEALGMETFTAAEPSMESVVQKTIETALADRQAAGERRI